MFWDDYPEPTWLSKQLVAILWLPMLLSAHRAVHYIDAGQLEKSYGFVHTFVTGNWISLGHYLYAPPVDIEARRLTVMDLEQCQVSW